MEEWKEYKLGGITSKIGSGATPKGGKESYLGGNIALIRSQNILDFAFTNSGLVYINKDQASKLNNVEVKENDILLNITGDSVARVCIVPQKILPARVNQHVAIIRGNDIVDNRYLLYYLQYIKPYLLSLSQGGATRNALTKKMLEDLDIKVPSKNVQNIIISVLSSLDDKIELNRRINENLEQQAQALFKSWFVDNKNNEFQYYELGDITFITAGGDKPSVYSKDLTEQCRIPIYSNGIENEGLYGYTTSAKINSSSITISARGTIGYVCLRTEPYVPIVRLISVVPNIENLSAEYLYLWALTQNINGTGTTQQQLTVPNFRHTLIGIPTKEIMIRFNNIVFPIFQRIVINKNENKILSQLRDTLLPRLMSGKLEIKDNSYD